jgi:hypothetical protein
MARSFSTSSAQSAANALGRNTLYPCLATIRCSGDNVV